MKGKRADSLVTMLTSSRENAESYNGAIFGSARCLVAVLHFGRAGAATPVS